MLVLKKTLVVRFGDAAKLQRLDRIAEGRGKAQRHESANALAIATAKVANQHHSNWLQFPVADLSKVR